MLTYLVHPCATTRLWNLWSKKLVDISLRSHHLAALEPSTCLARVGKTAPATGELGLWGPGLNKVGAAPWLKAGKHGKTGAKPLAKPFLVLKDLESGWWVKCTAHFIFNAFSHQVRTVRKTFKLNTFQGDGLVEHHRDRGEQAEKTLPREQYLHLLGSK